MIILGETCVNTSLAPHRLPCFDFNHVVDCFSVIEPQPETDPTTPHSDQQVEINETSIVKEEGDAEQQDSFPVISQGNLFQNISGIRNFYRCPFRVCKDWNTSTRGACRRRENRRDCHRNQSGSSGRGRAVDFTKKRLRFEFLGQTRGLGTRVTHRHCQRYLASYIF